MNSLGNFKKLKYIRNFSLLGKNCVVTGGSRGLGKIIADHLALLGGNCIILSRNAEKTRHVIPNSSRDQNHGFYSCDVSSFTKVKQSFADIEKNHQSIDVLVNCAGINVDSLLIRMNENDIDKVIATNLNGTIYCSKMVVKSMLKNGSGCIINIGSVIGSHGNVGQSVYAASKSGLHGFTKSLAKEVGSRGIRVNLIEPGFFLTEMTKSLSEEKRSAILKEILLNRFGSESDLTSTVEFLLKNEYITGQTISIDGGLHL